MKKKFLILATSSFVVLGGIIGLSQFTNQTSQSESTKAVVIIKEDRFEPEFLEIKKGTMVIFKNEASTLRWPASNIHPTHGIYPEFDPREPVKPGDSWEFRFNKAGSWKYHDHLFPSLRGVIKVTQLPQETLAGVLG